VRCELARISGTAQVPQSGDSPFSIQIFSTLELSHILPVLVENQLTHITVSVIARPHRDMFLVDPTSLFAVFTSWARKYRVGVKGVTLTDE
jgi:hypothetical protein